MPTNTKKYSYVGKKINVTCTICNTGFSVAYNTYHHKPKNYQFKCSKCMKKYRANLVNSRINNVNSEKIKLINARKQYWDTMTPAIKKKRIQKLHEGHDKWYDSLSDIEKDNISKNIKNKALLRYKAMTIDEKKHIRHRAKEWWNKLSIEDKNKWSERTKTQWKNLTDDDRIILLESLRNYHKSLSKEAKEELSKKISIKGKERWKSLSPEEKQEYSIRAKKSYNNGYSDWYKSLTSQEKANFHRNILSKSQGKNKLHKVFENHFIESILHSKLYFVPEVMMSNNNVEHLWDYAIYEISNDNLVAVVDLDGAYFHGDSTDYNGMQSQEEYDEKRYLSVKDGIICYIINEELFSKSFKKFIKIVFLDYDNFINKEFKACRSLPDIPYPSYSNIELLKSYNQLCKTKCDDKYHQSISINNREADRIINHFHHSIYSANRRGKLSPYAAWHDDKFLRKVIENRTIYVNTLNPNKILQGFNISKIAPKVSVFSAGRAKLLIHKYLDEYDEIFDPFSGFSGRMLGSISLNKIYIGQDISEIHIREGSKIIEFLRANGISLRAYLIQRNILQSSGEYECLFTCPPYSDKEQWLEVPPDKRMCDDWIDECLKRFRCNKYLFVVDNTEKYKDYIVDEISNKSHLNHNSEYIIMIQSIIDLKLNN